MRVPRNTYNRQINNRDGFEAMRKRNQIGHSLAKIFISAVFVLVIVGAIFTAISSVTASASHSSCSVTDKDRTKNDEGGSEMRIYTKGCNGSASVKTFKVADNIFLGKFSSADTFAEIEVGGTYNFETRGYRVPLFSLFPNIVEVTEVSAPVK